MEKRDKSCLVEHVEKPKGYFIIRVLDGDCTIVIENMIVFQGLNYLARNLALQNTVNIDKLIISDTTQSPTLNDTSVPGNIQAQTATVSVDNRKVIWSAIFNPLTITTIRRLALCLNSDGTGLFATAQINPISFPSGGSLQVIYTLEFTP